MRKLAVDPFAETACPAWGMAIRTVLTAMHAQVKKQGVSRGLLVYPMGATVDGWYGDHVLLAPPFIAGAAELARSSSGCMPP